MNLMLLRSRRSLRTASFLSRRLLPQPLSIILITPSTYHQSQLLQPSTLPTPTSLVSTFFHSQILVEFREEFQVVEVLYKFLGIIYILVAFLLNQVLLLMLLLPSIEYPFYFIFAFVILQLDISVYNDLSRSLSQFQQRYIEYRIQLRSSQQFKSIINQSNLLNNLERSNFLKV